MPKKIENVRERIIETAYNLFILEGYDKVNTSRISRECEIAAGTLFNYFPTKWDLLKEILHEVKKRSMGYFFEMVEQAKSEEEKTSKIVQGMYYIIDQIGRLGKKFYGYILSQDSEYIDNLKKEDEKEEEEMIALFRNNYQQLADKDREFIWLLMRSFFSIILSTYTEEKDQRKKRIEFSCWAFHGLLQNLETKVGDNLEE